jgi:predicted RNA binding protein YcfA (HicA-like mRNA interferase family)
VKRRELERKLENLGWRLLRHGGKHDVWTNTDETKTVYIPRHKEINEQLAKAILRDARR